MPTGAARTTRGARATFVQQGSIVFGSTIVVNVFNYLFHFALSRKLGVVDYGALQSMIALLMIVLIPTAIAATIIAKYTAEFDLAGDERANGALSRYVVRTSLIAGGAAALISLACTAVLGAYLQISDPVPILAFALLVGTNIITPLLRAVLQGRQAFVSFSISNVIEALAKALLGVGFVLLGFGLGGAIVGYTIGTAASVIYTLVVVRRRFSPPGDGAVRFDRARLYETAAGAAASSGAITILAYADVLLVKHFFIPETAGLFGVVSLIGKMIFLGIAFVPVVILPKATEVAMQGRNPGPLLLQAGAIMAAVAAVALGCVYFFGPAIVAIVSGGAYLAAGRYLFAYTAAMSLLSAAQIVIMFKVGLHRFDFVASTLLVVAGEVTGISLFHDSLQQVVTIVLAGHALAFLGSLYRLTAPAPARDGVV